MTTQDDVVARLARERWRALVGYGYVLTGSVAEAEDLVQEALVRAVLRGRDGADLHAAEAYVRRSVLTLYVDGGRRRTRFGRVRHLVAVPDSSGPTGDPAHTTAEQAELRDALATLSPRERACVVLRHLEGLSVAETAEQLGVSDGAVKRYTSTAMARLERTLGALRTHDETTSVERSPR